MMTKEENVVMMREQLVKITQKTGTKMQFSLRCAPSQETRAICFMGDRVSL